MKRTNPDKRITIDAAGRSLGRVATEVANTLRGKNTVNFAPNVVPNIEVSVTNISQALFTGTKLEVKEYHRFSGYPGGLKTTTLKQEYEKDPVRLFRNTVKNMLPKNRLNAKFLQNLKVFRTVP